MVMSPLAVRYSDIWKFGHLDIRTFINAADGQRPGSCFLFLESWLWIPFINSDSPILIPWACFLDPDSLIMLPAFWILISELSNATFGSWIGMLIRYQEVLNIGNGCGIIPIFHHACDGTPFKFWTDELRNARISLVWRAKILKKPAAPGTFSESACFLRVTGEGDTLSPEIGIPGRALEGP